MKISRLISKYVILLLFVLLYGINGCRSGGNENTNAAFPPAPAWWHNPHQDDNEFMFVKANAVACATEQEARDKAYSNALSLLARRIGSNVSVKGADVNVSSNYALRNTRIYGEHTVYYHGKWYSWALVSYPQSEKRKLLERLEKSAENLNDIRTRIKKLSNDFKVSLKTKSGKLDFRDGEKVAFTLTAPIDCYVAVFCHQSDGSTVLLFPNSWSANTKVYANTPVDIPGTDKRNFEIVAGPPYGTDIVQVIACSEYSLLHKRVQHMAGVNQGYCAVPRGLFSRGIDDSVSEFEKSDKPPRWGETSISISTYPEK